MLKPAIVDINDVFYIFGFRPPYLLCGLLVCVIFSHTSLAQKRIFRELGLG